MASVVFLRGVNVGGARKFQPSVLAKELAALKVKSIGAVGTFVVGTPTPVAKLKAAFAAGLPFETEIMVCTGRALLDLVADDPFGRDADGAFVSVLGGKPKASPKLPLRMPAAGPWQVEVAEVRGAFALSRRRPVGSNNLYPNEVVERHFGVAATTRGWPTFLRIRDALER